MDLERDNEIYHTYSKDDREAIVVKHKINGSWGVYMQIGDKPGLLEYYPVKSEAWAENVAENFVEKIRNL